LSDPCEAILRRMRPFLEKSVFRVPFVVVHSPFLAIRCRIRQHLQMASELATFENSGGTCEGVPTMQTTTPNLLVASRTASCILTSEMVFHMREPCRTVSHPSLRTSISLGPDEDRCSGQPTATADGNRPVVYIQIQDTRHNGLEGAAKGFSEWGIWPGPRGARKSDSAGHYRASGPRREKNGNERLTGLSAYMQT
jgi:hypothetical protein